MNINSPGSNVGADQEPHFFSLTKKQYCKILEDWLQLERMTRFSIIYLETVQVVFPLIGLTITMETNTRQLVAFAVWT